MTEEGAGVDRSRGGAEVEVRLVLVTAPNEETGEFLARELVEERLAACASVIPKVVSVYWWEDEVQRDDEVLVLFKTRPERIDVLRERVLELHPYEVPEFLVVPVEAAHEAYVRWIAAEATGAEAGD